MTALRTGIVVALGLLAFSPSARAQVPNLPPGFGNNSFDPFSAYYGYYIPRNQSIAAQRAGGATESINLNAQARQAEAQAATRAGALYNLDNPYEFVPLENRNFVRPPTVLLPGQRAGPGPSSFYGRPHGAYSNARVGGAANGGRLPQSRGIGGMGGTGGMRGMGGMGNFGNMGRPNVGGFGGFGGGFR
ncbi:hypothetical protein [Tautonia plasticadhaerens]|uniref:Uncharacterized protein n=1 Tax=Tautonia plasticadhaerens TaxID=2527974 RepID=A0A518HB45_9BACT|nr:hypothetical protein [Tautonia plasticadhaerens]QDV38082.1 hypothetical protein ElP_60300 [Tautonia plasticadhaerens]